MEIKTLTREQIKEHFPKRAKNSHKGTYGKNVIFASCEEYVGACKIAALGSLSMRMGSGYTALALTKTVANSVSPEIFECIISLQEEKEGKFYFNEEKVKSAIQKAQSVAVGMGMGNTEETKKLVEYLLKNFTGTLLIDADGLNSITEEMLLTERKCSLILTPHIKEFSRLTGLTINEIKRDNVNLCVNYAKKWNANLLLKSEESVISNGVEVYKTVNSSPALAKAGSGDFLAGAISALAISKEPIKACAIASQLIAFTASDLAQKYNENVILARDIADGVRDFFK